MKKTLLVTSGKYLFISIFLISSALVACGQDNKAKKGTIQSKEKVNMKDLQQKEKKMPADSLRPKYDKGPDQNTSSKPLEVPKNAVIKKTKIVPGKLKKDSLSPKNKPPQKQ